MKTERHTGPRPWEVRNPPTETALVIDVDGQAILAIVQSETVTVPYFKPTLPEREYIDALVETCLDEKGRAPEFLHIFEHEDLLGVCVL